MAGFERIRPTYEGSDLPIVLSLVAAGLGVALVPGSARFGVGGVVIVPLGRRALTHRTVLLALHVGSSLHHQLADSLRAALLEPPAL